MTPDISHLVKAGCFPRGRESDLVDGLLGAGEPARAALERWLGAVDLDTLAAGERRLLPLVADRVAELAITTPEAGRLAGMKRHAFAANMRLFHAARPVLAALSKAGCAPIIWKGMPLSQTCYASTAHRPMSDIDIVVVPDRLEAALRVLEDCAWHPKQGDPRRDAADLIVESNDFSYQGDMQLSLDVSFHIGTFPEHAAQRAILEASLPYEPGPEGVRVPPPAEHLLLILHHGMPANALRPLRWVFDAHALLEAQPVDWDRFAELANEIGIAPMVGIQLDLVARYGPGLVPAGLLERLSKGAVSSLQSRYLAVKAKPLNGRGLGDAIFLHQFVLRNAQAAEPSLTAAKYLWRLFQQKLRRDTPARIFDLTKQSLKRG
ncbi:MAG: nucleotidyltransferase family protein [Pseudomonadota bacterium]